MWLSLICTNNGVPRALERAAASAGSNDVRMPPESANAVPALP
jgi:hypothetical protein